LPLLFLFVALFGAGSPTLLWAQSNPTPQALPYRQDFSTLAHSSTTYPAGWQGWSGGIGSHSAGGGFQLAPGTADLPLTSNATAATTAGEAVYNLNGKIGPRKQTSNNAYLVLAVNTTGYSAVRVEYDAMTVRINSNRVMGLILQYRVGTSGNFTATGIAEYQNPISPTQTSGTAPIGSGSRAVVLPSACNNQVVVQLRWVTQTVSGSSASADFPTLVVDNIKVGGELALSGGAISFGAVCTNATATQSFTATGNNLNTSNVTVSAVAGYSYATAIGGPYTSTLSLIQPGGNYSQQIWVRFTPTAEVAYNGTITVAGGGAISQTKSVTGSGLLAPVVEAGSYGPFCSVDPNVDLVGTPSGGTWSGTGVTGDQFDPGALTHTLTYSFTGGNGCTSSDDVTITVSTATTWYLDQDNDSFGDPDISVQACDQPVGHVANNTDCDDSDPAAFPGAPCTGGDLCISGETWNANCDCQGGNISPDSDGDGLCDAVDDCPMAVAGIADFDTETCACELGYFATITDIGGNDVITACTICPPGSFCPDGIVFTPCPQGFANGSSGQTACSACPPGRFGDINGATVCSLCPANTYNPSSAQTQCLACPSGEGSDEGATACSSIGTSTDVTIELRTPDGSSDQISWQLADLSGVVVCEGGNYPEEITDPITDFCSLPDGCYRLRVFDSVGDGFGMGGGYQLRLAGGNAQDIRIIDNLGNFTSGSLSAIGSGPAAICFPMATDPKPLFLLRDKLDFVSGTYLVCEPVTAVSAQWQVGDQTDDGYEFWLFDPNGTYSYRRFRNHATSDGFGNVGATRACHMKINNWFASQAAPANRLLNVRIRTRVNGVNGNWGPAYRFKIDPMRAACPLTQLNNIPGNQFESCGKTRSWGGSNLLHARPVSGANRYQWRFRTVGEPLAPIIIRTTNTYFLTLNWTANPLVPGKTYEVDVRTSKNAGATWCTDAVLPALVDPWGTVCLITIQGSNAQGAGQNLTLENTNANLSLYPNPNRGDQVMLSIDAVDEGVQTISVDFFDLAGHRTMARTIPTQGNNLKSMVELNGLAAGVYIVHITAGNKVYTERLVVTH